eukprot:10324898-Lingulodinium_polyedra.AAC.1
MQRATVASTACVWPLRRCGRLCATPRARQARERRARAWFDPGPACLPFAGRRPPGAVRSP